MVQESATENIKFGIFSDTSIVIFSVALEIQYVFIDTSSTIESIVLQNMIVCTLQYCILRGDGVFNLGI